MDDGHFPVLLLYKERSVLPTTSKLKVSGEIGRATPARVIWIMVGPPESVKVDTELVRERLALGNKMFTEPVLYTPRTLSKSQTP